MRWVAIIAGIFAFTIPNISAAQVYQIGDGGAVSVREGGGVVVWRDPATDNKPTPKPEASVALPVSVPSPQNYATALQRSAQHYGLSPALLEAVVWQESRWHDGAISPKGAIGLAQLMPATALALRVDAHDPIANLDAGAHYLRLLLDHFGGDVVKALAAYNAGVARVERAGGIPPIHETQNYVTAILARLDNQLRKP
jgi:soluble lytic murein transglycosylase-like protein